jgi:hypothetical protein
MASSSLKKDLARENLFHKTETPKAFSEESCLMVEN